MIQRTPLMHFVLDGYNILMRLPELFKRSSVSFEASREGLVNFLSRYRPQGSVKNRVTVVFDGYAALKLNWGRLRQEGVEIIFSEEASADDRIVSFLKQGSHPKEIVVVTDDRELSLRVQDLEAKVLSIKEFIAKILAKQSRDSAHSSEEKKLSVEEERKITEELKRRWVKGPSP